MAIALADDAGVLPHAALRDDVGRVVALLGVLIMLLAGALVLPTGPPSSVVANEVEARVAAVNLDIEPAVDVQGLLRRKPPPATASHSDVPGVSGVAESAESPERSPEVLKSSSDRSLGVAAAFEYDDRPRLARASARLGGYRYAPQATLKLPTSQTWGRLDTLDDHFLRHGGDFGARSADEYASQASQFFQRSQQVGLPTKIDANGVIRVYDPASNTFGAYNPNGTTATFFTPKTGADYWAKQPGVAPWSP